MDKSRKKRFMAVLVSLAMVFSMIPGMAFATDPAPTEVTTESDLISAFASGGNIELGADISVSTADLYVGDATGDPEAVTLDLKGYTISIANNKRIRVQDGCSLTVNDTPSSATTGKISSSAASDGTATIYVWNGDLVLNGGKVEKNDHSMAVAVVGTNDPSASNFSTLYVGRAAEVGAGGISASSRGTTSNYSYGAVANIYGKVSGRLYINGTINQATGAALPVFNIYDGAVINSNTFGIYAAGYAKWNIYDADITGTTGIEIRAGQLIVNGGTIEGTATPIVTQPNGNGATTVGVGIGVVQHTTKLPIDVTINRGEISGYTAFFEKNVQNSPQADIDKVKVHLNGGQFTKTGADGVAVYSEDETGFITGGSYNTNPSVYVASGYMVGALSGGYYPVYAIPASDPIEPAPEPEIPAGDDVVETKPAVASDGTVSSTPIIDAINKATREIKDTVVVVDVVSPAAGVSPVVGADVFRAASEASDDGVKELVIETSTRGTNDIPATFVFKTDEITDPTIPVKTGVKEIAEPQVAKDELPAGAKVMAIELAHSGDFPGPANITLGVDKTKYKVGDKVYMYFVNSATGELELVEGSPLTVGADGTVAFTLTHASKYVFSNTPRDLTGIMVSGYPSMVLGSSEVFTIEPIPEDAVLGAVTWSSSNKKVATVDATGKVTAKKYGSVKITVAAGGFSDTTDVKVVPKTVTSVKAKAIGAGKARISWKKISGVTGYQVYRATKEYGTYKKVKTVKGSSKVKFVNSKLKKGKTYYYKVRAYKKVNGKNYYGEFSKTVKVKVK